MNPGTTLDVNGAITNRETAIFISGNAVIVPANVSQVQLTGAATATVTITAPTAPNAGQRLIVFNNTTGGFGATLDGVTIPNGKALEYVYSNSGWRSTDGGAVGIAGVNIYNTNGSLTSNRTVSQGANTLAFAASTVNAFSVDNTTFSVDATNKRIGIGTIAPKQQIHITESGASSGITTSFISGLAVTGTGTAAGRSGPGFYLENTSASAGSKLLKMNYSLNSTEPIFNIQDVSDDATTSSLQILTLTRSAKLGINATPNPASNLSVNGNAAIGNGYTTTAAPANGAIIQGNVGIGT